MSLGMDFTRRRLMAGGKKTPKYVWKVYNLVQQLDESTATTGSQSVMQVGPTLVLGNQMASTEFTYVNGVFTLVNPEEIYSTDIVGHYMTSLTSSGSVSGNNLYLITSIGSSSGMYVPVNYKVYSKFIEGRGNDVLFEVSSNMLDYPVNGIWDGDGLWYVLVESPMMPYVWAVYNFSYTKNDSTATTGSFSASRSRTKMAASSFTANASGFTLTNATSTSLQNMQVGQYFVDIITTSNSTATTGVYLYEVTGKSGSYTTTIQYKRYEVSIVRGETEIDRVESNLLEYPLDGEQDGLWYVMLRGMREVFVWDAYSVTNGKYESRKTDNSENISISASTIYTATSYKFNTATGIYTLSSPTQSNSSGLYYWMPDVSSGNVMYEASDQYSMDNIIPWYIYSAVFTGEKGAKTGEVTSQDINEYPYDGYQNGLWYTYSGTDTVEFDNR